MNDIKNTHASGANVEKKTAAVVINMTPPVTTKTKVTMITKNLLLKHLNLLSPRNRLHLLDLIPKHRVSQNLNLHELDGILDMIDEKRTFLLCFLTVLFSFFSGDWLRCYYSYLLGAAWMLYRRVCIIDPYFRVFPCLNI